MRAWIYRPAREAPLLAEFKAKVAHPLPWRPELTHPPLSPLSPLPADAADEFEIRLPGKVLPRPLRFERRRLDAGLAPFNC